MDLLSPQHVLLILLIVLVIVGSRKLRAGRGPIGAMAQVKAGRPLRVWLAVALMALAALVFIKFAFRLGY